jgi:DNA-binding IclR family transcriptional regulator
VNRPQGVKGVQSIVRAAAILRIIGESRDQGRTLTEVSRTSGLHVATANRILAALVQEGMIVRNEKTKRFFISYDLYQLCGNSYLARLKDELRDTLSRVAERSEDTAFLLVPMGNDAMCLDRVEGNYPIKTLTFDIGGRRPLGIGAGGLALLSASPPNRIEAVLRANQAKYRRHNQRTMADIRRFLEETRQNGFAVSIGNVTPGAASVALAVLNHDGEPVAAVAVAAVKERMKPLRRRRLAALLREELSAAGLSIHPDAPGRPEGRRRRPND